MKPTIVAGQLDRRITLQTRAVSRDSGTGAEVVTWTDGDTIWARVIESATAHLAASPSGAQVDTYARPMRIWIRWRSLDKSATRISYGGRILRITGTAEIGRQDGIELVVEEWAHE